MLSETSSTDKLSADFALVMSDRATAGCHDVCSRRDVERRVLFISYAFPPTGGGGVQRAVKFAKYLSSYGWRPTILTVANPSVPVQDHDLAGDLDPRNEDRASQDLGAWLRSEKAIDTNRSSRSSIDSHLASTTEHAVVAA